MRRPLALLLTAAATIGAAPDGDPAPSAAASPLDGIAARASSAPLPFAAALSDMPAIDGPGGWRAIPDDEAWAALARARPETRQRARWAYARSLVARGRGNEAAGVLAVMGGDDPDLELVPAWRLARGAALAQAARGREALAALGGEALAANPEACLWRMLAAAEDGSPALAQFGCALPALNARPAKARARFLLAASRAAVDGGRPAAALTWLGGLPDGDPAANLLRGKAQSALGRAREAGLSLARVARTGSPEQRADARVTGLEAAARTGRLRNADALVELSRLRFAWRGGTVERRALALELRLATEAGDPRGALAAGATLFRHHDLGKDAAPVLAGVHARLEAALGPESAMPVAEAAGLYWDHRDLAPAGAAGDALVSRLADRLQLAGLYARAAELLGHQLSTRVRDIARGPLSAKVAALHILAGRPERAIGVLRDTDDAAYPDEMLWDRRRVAAAALQLTGRTAEALAVLSDVPNGARIAAEIRWKAGDWAGLVDTGGPLLPGAGPLDEVGQAAVLRHAIALAMLGREDGLAGLRRRYRAAFGRAPSAGAFDLLTRSAGTIDPAALANAMAALPSASPAGAIGDLLDAEVAGKG